ncbi:MAG: MATE family efflux transporter [Lachnospiraceae bacterium]|nr:MATE family efflux transporter [Lachnospiraceae bacterium]
MNLEMIQNKRKQVILQFAIPSVIAMVLTAMINIIDGYFIGNYVGKEGLAAVNLGLPIVYFYLAVGLMIAVGGIAIAGRLLGANSLEEANQVFRQTMMLCLIVTVVITICMSFLLRPLSSFFQADSLTRAYFVDYYAILLFELPMMVLLSTCGMFIRGEGNPVFIMMSNLMTVILNIVLDYLFVKPLQLGVRGVALASLLSSGIVLAFSLLYFKKKSRVFKLGAFRFDKATIKEMILNGSSEFIGELSMCISMAAYNFVVLKYAGVNGVAAFTIIGYVSYVFSMIIIGFGQGMVPIVSFTFGARQHALAKKVRNTTMSFVVIAALVVFVTMTCLAGWYSSLFSNSQEVSALVVPGLRLQMSSFAFAGINTIASFYFTAIGKAKESAVISSMRGLIVLLIAIFVLSYLLGITGVWLVSLITEVVTLLFSICYMAKDAKK